MRRPGSKKYARCKKCRELVTDAENCANWLEAVEVVA